MTKSNVFENGLQLLTFQGTAITNIADNAASGALTDLYLSLHTADPTDAGDQGTSESAYTSYARVAVARTNTGFVVAAGVASLNANADFPQATNTGPDCTYFGVGDLSAATSGRLLYSGAITPLIGIADGVTPRLTTGTTITEE